MKYTILIYIWAIAIHTHAQGLKGTVFSQNREPVAGAMVRDILNKNVTTTDEDGTFEMAAGSINPTKLTVSAFGYNADTIEAYSDKAIAILLKPLTLGEVEIKANLRDASVAQAEIISSADLVKDACCNLSETFENSATVDVNYADAVSGAKEIRMLGLDGVYAQIMMENMPSIRSLGNTFGLNYVPGPWMSSIQVNKGAGSVVNGYESMSGQINFEYKKPQNAERLFVNLFLNQDLRNELNIVTAHKLKKNWHYLGALHSYYNWLKMDMNHDHYMDNPMIKNLNIMNRFTYMSGKVFSFWGLASVTLEDRLGGSMHFNPKENRFTQNDWGLRLQTVRTELFAKTGLNISPDNYIGIQYKYIYHKQSGYIGRRGYNGLEHFGYFNAIFQHDLTEAHQIKTGISTQINRVDETFDTIQLSRMEIVPGAFVEGSFNVADNKLMIVAGGRIDYHNMFGVFLTPRAHLRWNIIETLSLKVSAGRGYRVASVFAENFGWLANNRQVVLEQPLRQESAWNYGAGLSYKFFLNFREGMISVDYFRTDFTGQVVVDLEDTRLLQIYNLQGKSFANAMQAEFTYEPLKRFETKLAYKFEFQRTDFKSGRKIYPLRPVHRGLLSLQYTTKNKAWRFNSSLNWFGKARVPDTSINDVANQRSTRSKDWLQWNAQITFTRKSWEVYVGAENMLNFIQQSPIIAGEQPFSNQFDASLIWGPLRGGMAFAGVRWVLP